MMQNKLKCLFVIAIGGILMLFSFSGCFSKPDPAPPVAPVVTPQGMTPVETVQFYFEQWNDKNRKAMNSVIRDEMKSYGSFNSQFVYVELINAIDATEKYLKSYGIPSKSTYPNYVQYAVVEVEFEIEYKKGGFFSDSDGFPYGKTFVDNWHYVLGKTDEEADWSILDWGFP